MKQPAVSIIIPNFNCLPFLSICFDSIRKQQGVDYEILVVDDGSDDGSLEFLTEQTKLWPALRLLQQNHQGPGAARNLAAQYAEAPLLAFLDADDWWPVDKLARQVKFHQENPDIGLSFTDYLHINEIDMAPVCGCFEYWPEFSEYLRRQPRHGYFERLNNAQAMLLAENVIGTSSVIIKKSAFMAVQGFDTSLPSASDWDLWLKISKISNIGFSRDCLMHYLQRHNSVSANYSRRFTAVDIILNRYLPDIADVWPEKAKTAKASRMIARHEMLSGNREFLKAFCCAVSGFWLKPSRRHIKLALNDLAHAALRH